MSIQARITALAQAVAADIKSLVSGKAPTVHAHTVDDIPGLGPILDAATRTYWADILGKPSVFPAAPPAEVDLGTVSGTVTLIADAPYKRRCTVSGATTFAPATPAAGTAPTLRLRIVNGVAAPTISFSGVRWVGGVTPEFATANGGESVVVLDYGATGWIADGGPL